MSSDDTAASEHGADAETTQVPPPPRDEPGLAWSVDDDTDEMPTNRHGQLVWAGLGVLVLAITAALVLLGSTLFGRHTTNTARPQPVPSPPVTSTVAAAPPPSVTVTAAPLPAPNVAPQDRESQFLDSLKQYGILGGTGDAANYAIEHALNTCDYLATYGRSATLEYVQRTTIWTDPYTAGGFIRSSHQFYCPQLN